MTARQTGIGRRATTVLGWSALAGMLLMLWMALVVTPPDVNQKDSVRLLYLHVPTAWVAMYLSFGVTTLASALYLWRRTRSRFWDLTAGAAAEIGVLFLGLTLIVGSIWGRATWGVWWTWDARLTTTAVLFVMYVGYLVMRRVPGDPEVRSKRAAIVALIAFIDVPIVYKAVEWWRTLHQPSSVPGGIHGSMAWTLLIAVVAFTLLFGWLLVHRFRLAWAEQVAEDRRLEVAMAERHAEGAEALNQGPDRPDRAGKREMVP